jgi:hypothetical protein
MYQIIQLNTDEDISPNILLYSSLFFITNVITAILHNYYVYSFLFCILTITSVIVHSNDNMYTNIIDKIAVLAVVIYGAYMLYNKIIINSGMSCSLLVIVIIIITFLCCVYFYIYGFLTETYCFCDETCIAQKYHFIMHMISSFGHHLIIFL